MEDKVGETEKRQESELGGDDHRTAELESRREKDREMEAAERELRRYHVQLEELVRVRTAELTETNAELQREIAERKRIEKALQYRLKFEDLIANISMDFINLPSGKIDDGINLALQRIGTFADVDRSYVFLISENGTEWSNTHEWCAEGIEPQQGNLQKIDMSSTPWWAEKLGQAQSIHIPRIADLPPEADYEKQILQSQDIKSLVAVPMILSNKLIGFFGFDSVRRENVWDKETISLLRVAGQIFANVLEHERREKELRESEEKYRYIAENPFDGIMMSQEGMIVYANDSYCRMFGYEKEELIGENLLKTVAPEDAHVIEERTRKRFSGEKVTNHYEFRAMREDGTKLFIEVSVSEPFFYRNRPTVLAILRDITEKHRMEEELLKIQKLESVGTLAGGIAHDFNNILTAVIGNISLAANYEDMNKIRERLAKAEEASEQARRLTQQLLTFSSGGAPIRETVAIGDVLRDFVVFSLRGSNIKCEFSISGELWPVEADERLLAQAINNLVNYAKENMPDGGKVEVYAKNVTLESGDALPLERGKYVKVSLQYEGVVISKENVQRIFDPYFLQKHEGQGLSLAATYSIIKRHDGYITAESAVESGTTFGIYLPASPRGLSQKESGEDTKEQAIEGKRNVLVMDDEELIRDLVTEILTSMEYEVVTAEEGVETIRLYRAAREANEPFDAVIMDLTVPGGMGGKEAIQELLKVDPSVKAIVSSGYSNDPIMSDFKKHGFKGVIAKPYRAREIAEVLHRVITDTND